MRKAQEIAVLAARRCRAARDRPRKGAGADCGFEPQKFILGVVGDHLCHGDARLVQHDVAEAQPVGDRARLAGTAAAARDPRAWAARPAVRPTRSFRRAASPWSAAPRSLLLNRCGARGFAPPARRSSRRHAGPARRGRTDRFPRPSRACRKRRDDSARRKARAPRRSTRSGQPGPRPADGGQMDGLAVEALGGE